MAGIRGFTPSDDVRDALDSWWNTPIKNRYNILPLAEDARTRENVWAVPGLLAEPFESLKRVIASGGRTDTTYDDAGVPVSGRGTLSDLDGLNVAGIAPLGTAAMGAIPNGVGIFGGRLAKTANHEALSKAERMAAEGAPRENIWNETGWFQGPDQKWRFEIDDSGAQFTIPQQEKFVFHGDPISGSSAFVLQHPQLWEAYPELAKVHTKIARNEALGPGGFEGAYGGGLIHGSANSTGGAREMMLHELTHGVQEGADNFARGGNPDFGIPKDLAAIEAEKAYNANKLHQSEGVKTDDDMLLEQLFGPQPPLTKDWAELTPREKLEWMDAGRGRVYNKLAGEVEARAVQKRRDMTLQERQARPPWLDYDTPEADQIVRFANPDAAAAAPLAISGQGQDTFDANALLRAYGLL